MPDRPCGRPDCPIVDPDKIDRRRLRTVAWNAGREQYRGTRIEHAGSAFVPAGIGNGRFSPLVDQGHCYLAEQRSAAVLESVLHEANGPNPRIYRAQLDHHVLSRVRIAVGCRLLDLRDEALAELDLAPGQLTDAWPLHYACTRAVAARLAGSKGTAGFVWTSRQGRLHGERNPDGLAAEVLEHRRLDVAVLYETRLAGHVKVLETEPLTVDGRPTRFVQELASLLRIAIL